MLHINLNSRIINPVPERTVNDLLDIDWHVAVTEVLHNNPVGVAFALEPALLGQFDCENGLPCDPAARGYRTAHDCESYIVAYNDCAALWAEMVQRRNEEVDAERAWLDGELMELVDGMEDEIYWSRGMW